MSRSLCSSKVGLIHWVTLDFMGTYLLKHLRQIKMLKAQNYFHENMIQDKKDNSK